MDKVLTIAVMAAIIHAGTTDEVGVMQDREWSAGEAIKLYEEVIRQLEGKLNRGGQNPPHNIVRG